MTMNKQKMMVDDDGDGDDDCDEDVMMTVMVMVVMMLVVMTMLVMVVGIWSHKGLRLPTELQQRSMLNGQMAGRCISPGCLQR